MRPYGTLSSELLSQKCVPQWRTGSRQQHPRCTRWPAADVYVSPCDRDISHILRWWNTLSVLGGQFMSANLKADFPCISLSCNSGVLQKARMIYSNRLRTASQQRLMPKCQAPQVWVQAEIRMGMILRTETARTPFCLETLKPYCYAPNLIPGSILQYVACCCSPQDPSQHTSCTLGVYSLNRSKVHTPICGDRRPGQKVALVICRISPNDQDLAKKRKKEVLSVEGHNSINKARTRWKITPASRQESESPVIFQINCKTALKISIKVTSALEISSLSTQHHRWCICKHQPNSSVAN